VVGGEFQELDTGLNRTENHETQRTIENKISVPLPIHKFNYTNGKTIAGVAENEEGKRRELYKGKTAY